MRKKRYWLLLTSLVLIMATAFGFPCFADDNVTGGDGDTEGAASGYGMYAPREHLWKISLYVGKKDTSNKSSNLINDYYLVGNTHIYLKNTDWRTAKGTKYGAYNKVQYYNGTKLGYHSSYPIVITDTNCPKVPIACGGNVQTVRSYFGSTGTLNTVLNALASGKGTSKAGLVSNLNFTIAGQTKKWDSSYILPNVVNGKLQNRVPWVIVYEPAVVARLKDKTTRLAFTATEYALAQKNGWYNFFGTGSNAQKISKLTHQHLPTSTQLEFSWFGYPKYAVTNDSTIWKNDDIIKGGGWGMRYLDAQNVQKPKDFGVSFSSVPAVRENSTATIKVSWRNLTGTAANNVPCVLYLDGKQVWSGSYNFSANQTRTQSYNVSFGWGTQNRTLKAQINWAGRSSESNPNNNEATRSVKPAEYYEFSVSNLKLSKSSVYQGNSLTMTFRTDNWNQNKSYTSIPVEVLYDNKVVKTTYVNYSAYGYNNHTVTIPAGTALGKHTITVRVNWPNHSREANPNNNSASTTATVNKYYDLSVSELTLSKTVEYENRTITVRCRTDNWDRYNAYNSVPVQLVYGGNVIATQYLNYAAYATKYVTFTMNTGTVLGNRTVEVRINWPNRNSEVNPNNNSASKTITVKEDIDLTITPIQPNASYRAGTTVISSFNVKNLSTHDITPSRNLKVTFNAYYYNGAAKKTITTLTKTGVVVPAKGTQIVYFKWKVPVGLGEKNLYYEARVNSPQTLEESNYNNNEASKVMFVMNNPQSSTPNPEFVLKRPSGWYDSTTTPSRGGDLSFQWSEWRYENGSFKTVRYNVGLNAPTRAVLRPDGTNKSAVKTDSGWTIKSGYGINIQYTPNVYSNCPADARTDVQRCVAYFPEFNFSGDTGKYRTLELVNGQFVFRQNSNSIASGRMHFVPTWKQNGAYPVQIHATDLWTPMGMIQIATVDRSLTIQGSMYDDYYTNRN